MFKPFVRVNDKGMFPSDKGLTLETSASEILTEANLRYQLINNTKLPQSKSLSDIMERM